MKRLADVEALEQSGGIRFRRIPALVSDDALQFAQTHTVFIGPIVGVRVELLALLQGVPERRVAHDHGIQNAIGVERELILAKDTDLLRTVDRTLLWLNFARQDFHERRFAGSVRSGN